MVVIGLSGLSCSGKTTAARRIYERFSPRAIILHQDEWFKNADEIPMVGDYQDWDCPDALLLDEFYRHCSQVIQEHKNDKGFVIIIEGFLLFVDENLNELFDYKFLLDIPLNVLLERRVERKYPITGVDEEWWEDPPGYVENVVYKNYRKYHRKELDGECTDVTVLQVAELPIDQVVYSIVSKLL